MNKRMMGILVALTLLALPLSGAQALTMNLYDLKEHRVLIGEEAVQALAPARIILVGEIHDEPASHYAELTVIEVLEAAGRNVAIAMEMFRADSQAELNQWIAGKISEAKFKPIYLSNWNFPWSLYAPIFLYARANHLPMVGLNVPGNITTQVALEGFDSLSKKQRGDLQGITCNVSREYRDFIRRAYKLHEHEGMDFERFCEAQLVWDTAMATNADIYAKQHSDRTVVIMAGSGHARKQGIPTQLKKLHAPPFVVILPHIEGVFDRHTLTTEEADFIFLFN